MMHVKRPTPKLLGLVRCTRAAIPVMRRQGGGRIVTAGVSLLTS